MAATPPNFDRDQQPGKDTLSDAVTTSFTQPAASFQLMGLLRPALGSALASIHIGRDRLLIGRDPLPTDGCAVAILADESVSREHADIVRENAEFVLRDLGSSNGTYVDSIPIVTCVLRDGDAIQIGRNRFYFDRLKQLTESRGGELA